MANGAKYNVSLGKDGISILKKPYPPTLSIIAANITDTSVGASTWASGNQIWKGSMGVFIANDIKKENHSNLDVKPLNSDVHSIW